MLLPLLLLLLLLPQYIVYLELGTWRPLISNYNPTAKPINPAGATCERCQGGQPGGNCCGSSCSPLLLRLVVVCLLVIIIRQTRAQNKLRKMQSLVNGQLGSRRSTYLTTSPAYNNNNNNKLASNCIFSSMQIKLQWRRRRRREKLLLNLEVEHFAALVWPVPFLFYF